MSKSASIVVVCGILAGLAACDAEKKPSTPKVLTEESKVQKQIFLKELTTGIKPGKGIRDGYLGKWSFFGEERVIQHELHNGLVSSIEVGLGANGNGDSLKTEMEKKLSSENGKPVKFSCETGETRLAGLGNMAVTTDDCTVEHGSQVLTIHRTFPNYTDAAEKYPNVRPLYDFSWVKLYDRKMLADEKEQAEKAYADKAEKKLAKAKTDL